MLGNSITMDLISSGVLWYYKSYDHKAAVEEMKKRTPNYYINPLTSMDLYVPDEIKNQFIIWRKGKLRSLRFDPEGMINRMYIGRMYKFAKCFLLNDIGVDVKPILNYYEDKHGLISAGIAVDETQIM